MSNFAAGRDPGPEKGRSKLWAQGDGKAICVCRCGLEFDSEAEWKNHRSGVLIAAIQCDDADEEAVTKLIDDHSLQLVRAR